MCKQSCEQCEQRRRRLYIHNGGLRRYRAEYAGDNDAYQKKYLNRDTPVFANKTPDQTGGEEAIVKSLIRREHGRLFSKLGRKPKGTQARGLGPEKHLQNKNVQVLNGNKRDKYSGSLFHE